MNKWQDQFPIDAVITWVDGNDGNHQKKIADNITDTNLLKDLNFKTRFQQEGEIKFTVHSIIKYAPFIRNIFIVTDNQIPEFLETKSERYKKVVIIDHRDIYTDNLLCLPVFNSISIETKLYKIPGLAEHFIYFNDDFLLNKVVNPSDFFHEGKPIIRGKWHRFKEDIFYKKIFRKKRKPGYIIAQEKSAKILGYKYFFRIHHTPHPMRVSTTRSFFTSNSSLEQSNSEPKFRSIDQFLMVGLANHLEIKKDQCVLKNDYQLLHFRNYKKPLFWLKFKLNYLSQKQNKVVFKFGDVIDVPNVPTVVKSRPITDDNENSVLLKLNKVRHFTYTKDTIRFKEKKNLLIGRGGISDSKQKRIAFYKQYFDHPMCNLGQTNKKGFKRNRKKKLIKDFFFRVLPNQLP